MFSTPHTRQYYICIYRQINMSIFVSIKLNFDHLKATANTTHLKCQIIKPLQSRETFYSPRHSLPTPRPHNLSFRPSDSAWRNLCFPPKTWSPHRSPKIGSAPPHRHDCVHLRTVRIFTRNLNNKPIYCRGGYHPPAPYTPHKLSAGLSCRPPRRSPRRAHGVPPKKLTRPCPHLYQIILPFFVKIMGEKL